MKFDDIRKIKNQCSTYYLIVVSKRNNAKLYYKGNRKSDDFIGSKIYTRIFGESLIYKSKKVAIKNFISNFNYIEDINITNGVYLYKLKSKPFKLEFEREIFVDKELEKLKFKLLCGK